MSVEQTLPKTVVVIPCFNEAQRLDSDTIIRFLDQADHELALLLVNDGSTDDTISVLQKLKAGRPTRIAILDLPRNAGKAEAVRQGLLSALNAGASFIGFWDADLATPLPIIHDFRRLLASRSDLEWIYGSRVMMLGRRIERRTARHLAGRAFATGASIVLDLPVYDTQCGAKLFRVTPTLNRVLATPFLSRWIFDVELLARLARDPEARPLEQCVYEAPVLTWRDVAGSKVRPTDFVKAFGELVRVWLRYRPYLRSRPDAVALEEGTSV